MTYLETVKKLLGLDESHYPQMEIEKLPGLVSKSKGGIIERLIMSQCPGYYLGRGNAPFKRLWDIHTENGTTGRLTGCEYRDCWSCWNEETTSYLDYFTEVMIIQLWGQNIEVFLENVEENEYLSHREHMVTLLKDLISYNLCVRDFFEADMKDKKCRDGIELLHRDVQSVQSAGKKSRQILNIYP